MGSVETSLNEFVPDLIVEVTMVCDLKCKGCYAPTVPQNRGATAPSRFLSIQALSAAVAPIAEADDERIGSIAVRGGEPALHPDIERVLGLLQPLTLKLYLETNGNWVITGQEALLDTCARLGVIVKISFDSMHSLTASDLRRICEVLDRLGIEWVVAITEASQAEFLAIRNACPWIPNRRIIFQQKVTTRDSLTRPRFGVVHLDGQRSEQLTTKRAFIVRTQDVLSNHLSRDCTIVGGFEESYEHGRFF